MINYITLKTEIFTLLSTAVTTYEKDRVPEDASFPYATYDIESTSEGLTDNTEEVVFSLSINLLNHRKDKNTDIIEALVNSIDIKLNKKHIIKSTYYMQFKRQSILSSLPVADEYTQRRELNYLVNTYSEED